MDSILDGENAGPSLSRILLDSTLDAVITMDSHGRVVDWNGRAEAIFGWTAAEARGRHLADLIIPARYREAHAKGMAHFMSTGEGPILGRRMEMSGIHRDGEEFPVELTVSAARVGEDWLFIGFLRDQTEEKKTQGRLRVQNTFFGLLAASPSPDAIEPILLDAVCGMDPWLFGTCWHPDGNVLRSSAIRERKGREFPTFRAMTEKIVFRKGESLPGRVWVSRSPIWFNDIREERVPRSGVAQVDGLAMGFAIPVMIRNEVALIFEFFGTTRRPPDPELMAFTTSMAGQFGLYLERKTAEEEREALLLRVEHESERKHAILDLSPTPMILLEPGTAIIHLANKAALALAGGGFPTTALPTGWLNTDAQGRPIPPDELPSIRAARGETIVNAEVNWHVGGKVHSLLINSATLRDRDGKAELVVLTMQDLTHVKQVEEQLRQSQKMEAIGQLAGGIAHDFNNLLTAINGYSSMAIERLPQGDPLHDFLTEVLRSGERAAGLTRQLLAYSRKQVLEPKLWDLNVIVSGIQGMLRRLLSEDITLSTDLDPAPVMAKVDRGQVEQILLNLLLNSRDAMLEGGNLILETRRTGMTSAVTHGDAGPGPHVMLAVTDTGSGMTAEVKAHAFEPFFTTKEVGKGTGLGLSSVYGIVKQSGGSISVYSEVGQGTSIRIYFPESAPGQGEAEPVPAALPSNLGTESVLLVEDEEAVRRFAAQALEVQGYTVRTAANGREALEILGRGPSPDLVITDVVMPDIGGQVLAERIRSLDPMLPILFISGYTEGAVIHRGLMDTHASFLPKPFGPSDLARAVRAALDRSAGVQRETEMKASE